MKNSTIFIVLAFAIVAAGVGIAIQNGGVDLGRLFAAKEPSLEQKAEVGCEEATKEGLASPSSFKKVSYRGGVRLAMLEFDAQNSFGAVIRATAVCETRTEYYDGKITFVWVHSSIDGQLVGMKQIVNNWDKPKP